jgi:nuclear pore complex protein Nup85
LVTCHDLDIWLSAHLADIFDKLSLLPDEERFDMSLRDYFLLEYTDLLAGHPKHSSLWRIVVDYLQAAGEEGRCRLKEYIMHVGLDLSPPEPVQPNGEVDGMDGDDAMDVEDNVDPKFRHIRDLREICASLRLDDEYLVISQVLAEKMIRTGDFGIAATIHASSGDTDGLTRLADKLLETYIIAGESRDGPLCE